MNYHEVARVADIEKLVFYDFINIINENFLMFCNKNSVNATQSLHKETSNWWNIFFLYVTIMVTQR